MIDGAAALQSLLSGLTLYQETGDDSVGEALRRWMEWATRLEQGKTQLAGSDAGGGGIRRSEARDSLRRAYTDLFRRLAEEAAESGTHSPGEGSPFSARGWVGDDSNGETVPEAAPSRMPGAWTSHAWGDHWIGRILIAENPFSLFAAHGGPQGIPPVLREAAAHDLEALQQLAYAGSRHIRRVTEERAVRAVRAERAIQGGEGGGAARVPGISGVSDVLGAETAPYLPEWEALPIDPVPEGTVHREAFLRMAARFRESLDRPGAWGRLVGELAAFYREVGCGPVARFGAFRWEEGRLLGISTPDPVRLKDLIGYEAERAQVVENTAQFVRGLPANNVLLYGERGTGKSATVKALLHQFGGEGLRLVELPKSGLRETARIFRTLRESCQRFILFIDDLSFEGEEVAYKELKAVLEGGLERQPENVRIYATSNRRHLVQERMRERPQGPYGVSARPGEDEEVRGWDVVQERLSLADRFGLTVIFQAPEQDAYLEIVEGLAARRGLQLLPEELRRAALRWTLQQNGRSARTAHQFIDHLVGQTQMKQSRNGAGE